MTELIVLVDETGKPLGSAPKLTSHHLSTPLHLAFSCYLFNRDGEFLLTKRAESKKVWPGVWSNSVCGHPGPGETLEQAIKRRADYELGLKEVKDLRVVIRNYRYKTLPFNGIVENEFCPVYLARVSGEPKLNPEEVSDYRWVDWEDVKRDIVVRPGKYSFWFKDQLPKINDLVSHFLARN